MPFTYEHARPSVAVDSVVLHQSLDDFVTRILLIKRGKEPFKDSWALPGGFLNMDESLEVGARRELFEETGLKVTDEEFLGQLITLGDPARDPRGRVISVVFLVKLSGVKPPVVKGIDDAKDARWFELFEVFNNPGIKLAFDHEKAIRLSDWSVRGEP